jgi:hypothetical protein
MVRGAVDGSMVTARMTNRCNDVDDSFGATPDRTAGTA